MTDKIYSVDEISRIVAPIAKRHGLSHVALFGSYARGTATAGSDVDLCVGASEIKGLFALGGLYSELEDALGKRLDLVTERSLELSDDRAFVDRLRKDQVMIYERF